MKKAYIFIITELFLVFNCNSQVVNGGNVYVGPGSLVGCRSTIFVNKTASLLMNEGEFHLYGDLENNGAIDFQNDNGAFYFDGSIVQNLTTTNSGSTFFEDVYFNTYGLNVMNTFSVNRAAYFNEGVVNNNFLNSEVFFNTNAEAFGMSNNSYINSKIYKEGNNYFTFPLGSKTDNSFRPFFLKADSSSDLFLNEYHFANSNALYPHSNKDPNILFINELEYWEITNGNNVVNSVEGGFLIDDNKTSDNVKNHLYGTIKSIVSYDTIDSKWVIKGGLIDSSSNIITNPNLILETGPYTLGRIKSSVQEDLDLFIYNALSPNGNNLNEYLKIEGVENYPNNNLTILNRYGEQLYFTKNYGPDNLWFGTYKDKKLPSGTYFYLFKFVIENGATIEKTGYLYIN